MSLFAELISRREIHSSMVMAIQISTLDRNRPSIFLLNRNDICCPITSNKCTDVPGRSLNRFRSEQAFCNGLCRDWKIAYGLVLVIPRAKSTSSVWLKLPTILTTGSGEIFTNVGVRTIESRSMDKGS